MNARFFKILSVPLLLFISILCSVLLIPGYTFDLIKNYETFGATQDVVCYLDHLLPEELSGELLYLTLPALMGIPYLNFMYEEITGKRYRMSLLRSGRDRYITKHIFQAACSGIFLMGTALFLSMTFSCIIVSIKGIPVRFFNIYNATHNYPLFYAKLARHGMGWLYFAMQLLAALFYGALWPVIGVAAVFWTGNKYVAASIPFLFSAFMESAASNFSIFRKSTDIPSFEWIRLSNLIGTREWLFYKAYGGIPCMLALFLIICGASWTLIRFRLDAVDRISI